MFQLYLAGPITASDGTQSSGERSLPGRQGRRAIAHLALNRRTGASRDQLIDAIWGNDATLASDSAVDAVVSKLRRWLRNADSSQTARITVLSGFYRLELPRDAVIDIERVGDYISRAENALRAEELTTAYAWASAAWSTTHLPFLPGEEAGWIEPIRNRLAAFHASALEIFAEHAMREGDRSRAIAHLEDLIAAQPFRESAYRALMHVHRSSGNDAEAVAIFQRCRDVIKSELGTEPSAETRAASGYIPASIVTPPSTTIV